MSEIKLVGTNDIEAQPVLSEAQPTTSKTGDQLSIPSSPPATPGITAPQLGGTEISRSAVFDIGSLTEYIHIDGANRLIQSSNFVAGTSGWIIRGDGSVEFGSGVFRGDITATSGRIANWYINTNTLSSGAVEASSNVLIDSANSLIRLGPTSGNYITLDGANLRIRSSNYVAGASGFTIEPGLVEAENIKARGSLAGTTFKYDVVSAVGGQLMVANADILSTDMAALDASTMTIKGDVALALNDVILIRAVATSGIEEEYLRVTSGGIIDSYAEGNSGGHFSLYSTQVTRVAQSFAVTGAATLGSCKFYLFRANSPTGNIVAKLYAHSGVYGTSSEPTGAALATSDTIDVTTLSASSQLVTFTFSGANQYSLSAATKYVISVEYTGGDGSNYIGVGSDSTSPTHSGNTISYNGAYSIWAGTDVPFYVYSTSSNNTYTVTRDLAGTYVSNNNPVWKAGTPITVIGSSDGASAYSGGYLRLIGAGANAPHYSVFKRTGVAYDAVTEYCRLGNLNGFLGYVSEEYGLAIGESTKYLKYDPTNGLQIAGQIQSTVYLTAGEALTDGNAVMIGTGTQTYTGVTQAVSDTDISSSTDWWGQTFLTSSRTVGIKSLTFGIKNTGGSTDNYEVSIRTASGNVPTGSDIGVTATTAVINGVDGDVTFTFATPIAVSPSTTYAIVLRKTSGTSGSGPKYKNSNVYANGNYATSANSGSSWTADTNKDFRFSTTDVYTNAGQIYKATALANNEFVNGFIGFVVGSFSAGQTATILIVGQTTNLSGLTVGSAYYLSDTLGAISTSAGSMSKKIGIALSATSLLILNS